MTARFVLACLAVLFCAGCGAYRANVACQAVVEKEDAGRGVQVGSRPRTPGPTRPWASAIRT
jgi:hypothetical protein